MPRCAGVGASGDAAHEHAPAFSCPQDHPAPARIGFVDVRGSPAVFILLDLPSQAIAVQHLLRGTSLEEKLAWLAGHGTLTPKPKFVEKSVQAISFGLGLKTNACSSSTAMSSYSS